MAATDTNKDELIEGLRRENAALRARIEELERLLRMNSRNSSKPPSSDGPNTSLGGSRKRRKKRGAQQGHEPHLKSLLPPDQVTRTFTIEPEVCQGCGGSHFIASGKDPLRDQFIEIPPIKPDVTEYVRPLRRCAGCRALVHAPMPDDAPKKCFGPNVLASLGVLTGVLNISKRKALLAMNEVFGVPMSLGGLSNSEREIADAAAVPYEEALKYARQEPVANADETGWPRGNRAKGWLWTLCSSRVAAFMVHAKRGQEAARALLGDFSGVLGTDRWGGYNGFRRGGLRQICWAHLLRDFQAVSEAKGKLGEIGAQLHGLAQKILRLRGRVRDGTLRWRTFQKRMRPLMPEVETLLQRGAAREGALAGKCREIFKRRSQLWVFVERQDVEPTNNHAERMVRQGVLWRKGSFGTQSERGARYVERILSISATCRLQGKNVIHYLRELCHNYRHNLAPPPLIA